LVHKGVLSIGKYDTSARAREKWQDRTFKEPEIEPKGRQDDVLPRSLHRRSHVDPRGRVAHG
jgi:hypothetical protein